MSQQLCELCVLLVEQIYGTLPSTIFSILSSRDRLSLPQLIHYSRNSELSPRYVKHGLAVLVERQLAFHYESLDDGITYFEANLQNAYDLTRTGKYVQIVESHPRFGHVGADIVIDFQSLGSISQSELRERFVRDHLTEHDTQKVEPTSSAKETAETHLRLEDDLEKRKKILEDLFDSRHIVIARGNPDYLPPYEFHDQIEFEELRKYPNGPKGKEKKDLARATLARKREERDDNKASYDLIEEIPKISKDHSNNESGSNAVNRLSSGSKETGRVRRLNNGRGYGSFDGTGDSDDSDGRNDITVSKEQDNFLQSWGLLPAGLPQVDGPSDPPTGVRRSERLRSASVERSKSAGLPEVPESAQSETKAMDTEKLSKATRSTKTKRRLEEIAEADEPEQTQEARASGQSNGNATGSKDTVKSTRSSKRQRVGTADADGGTANATDVRKSTRSKSRLTESAEPPKVPAFSKKTRERESAKNTKNKKNEPQKSSKSNGVLVDSIEPDDSARSVKRHPTETDDELVDTVERPTKMLRTTRSKATSLDPKPTGSIAKSKRKRDAEASDVEDLSERPTKLRKSARLNSAQPETAPTNGIEDRLKQLDDHGKAPASDKQLPNGDRNDSMVNRNPNPSILGSDKDNKSQKTSNDSESTEPSLPSEATLPNQNQRRNIKRTQNLTDPNGTPLSHSQAVVDSQSIGQTAVSKSRGRKKPNPLPVIEEAPTSDIDDSPANVATARATMIENVQSDNNVTEAKYDRVTGTSALLDSEGNIARRDEDADSAEDESMEPNEIFFRINHEKFTVSMRSHRLLEMAERHLGAKTSGIFRALLSALDWEVLRCYDPYEPKVKEEASEEGGEEDLGIDDDDSDIDDACATTTERISIELKETTGLFGTQGEETAPKDTKSRPQAAGHSGSDLGGSNPSEHLEHVEEHLKLLAQHSHRFVHPVVQNGVQKWEVDFDDLCSILLQQELENVISARFDQPSARIICFLNALGKLDEKELADRTLIPQKDLRAKLARLHEVGYIDLQEIPRDATRQPIRTIYLWHFNRERCRKLILDDTYKAMARLIQRVTAEKEKVQRTIDKSERTDVVGREDELLNERDKGILRSWRAKEEKIWVQVGRLDDMVAVLRDFLPLHNVI